MGLLAGILVVWWFVGGFDEWSFCDLCGLIVLVWLILCNLVGLGDLVVGFDCFGVGCGWVCWL